MRLYAVKGISENTNRKFACANFRASLKTRLIKEKTDRCGSCKETFRRRAAALRGRMTKHLSGIAVFSQKGFLEMPLYKTKNHVKYVVFRLLQLNRLACLEGFEPPTYWFVASHSIQLSYKHIVLTTIYILPLFSSIVKVFFEICRFTYLSYYSTLIIMHIAIFSFSY